MREAVRAGVDAAGGPGHDPVAVGRVGDVGPAGGAHLASPHPTMKRNPPITASRRPRLSVAPAWRAGAKSSSGCLRELPQPDEPRHAGRRSQGGTRSAMRASTRRSRVDQRVGADPLGRRRGRQDGSRVTAGLDEPAHQVLVRCARGASSRSRSPSSRAAPPAKDRNPYRRRSSARCSCRVSDRTA